VEWTWDATIGRILETLKQTISQVPVLRLFDPERPVTLSGSINVCENLLAFSSSDRCLFHIIGEKLKLVKNSTNEGDERRLQMIDLF
jgi:hypothetical protein